MDILPSQWTRDIGTTSTQRCPNVHDVWATLNKRCTKRRVLTGLFLIVLLHARHRKQINLWFLGWRFPYSVGDILKSEWYIFRGINCYFHLCRSSECSSWNIFFPLRVDPIFKGLQQSRNANSMSQKYLSLKNGGQPEAVQIYFK